MTMLAYIILLLIIVILQKMDKENSICANLLVTITAIMLVIASIGCFILAPIMNGNQVLQFEGMNTNPMIIAIVAGLFLLGMAAVAYYLLRSYSSLLSLVYGIFIIVIFVGLTVLGVVAIVFAE